MAQAIESAGATVTPRGEKIASDVAVEWSEVKHEVLAELDGKHTPLRANQRGHDVYCMDFSTQTRSSWLGGTTKQMKDWLENGYHSPELDKVDEYTPIHKKRRSIMADEGAELRFDSAWSGDPTPWVEWEQRERKPGLRVEAEFFFAAGVPNETIGEYGAWLGGFLQGMTTKGYDLEIVMTLTCTGYYTGDRDSVKRTTIRVKREGEQMDLHDFSALFSPCGTRVLGFTGMAFGAMKLGKQLTNHYATSRMGSDWKIRWDEATRTIGFDVPQRGSAYNQYDKAFDPDKMDAEIRAVSDLLD